MRINLIISPYYIYLFYQYYLSFSIKLLWGEDITDVLIIDPESSNSFTQDLIAAFTADTSPVNIKKPFPPNPFAILVSINFTLDAFTAMSPAFIAVNADIGSIAPIDFTLSISVNPFKDINTS